MMEDPGQFIVLALVCHSMSVNSVMAFFIKSSHYYAMDTFIASLVTAEYNQFGKFVKTLQMFRGICNPMRIFNMEKMHQRNLSSMLKVIYFYY